jgi:hypothetical protein
MNQITNQIEINKILKILIANTVIKNINQKIAYQNILDCIIKIKRRKKKEYKCNYCDRDFNSRQARWAHEKKCKEINITSKKIEKITLKIEKNENNHSTSRNNMNNIQNYNEIYDIYSKKNNYKKPKNKEIKEINL